MFLPQFKTSKTSVPILKNSDIDTDAESLLRDYNPDILRNPQPLDVEDFTENYLGLNIHFENLSHNGCIWGCMVFNDRRIPVYVPELNRAEYCPVNADTVVIDNSLLDEQSEVAFRSTMLHECGHYVYHKQKYKENDDQISLFSTDPRDKVAVAVCRSADIVGYDNGQKQRSLKTDRDWVEHHAKYFSAALLMPKSMVELVCNQLGLRNYISDKCCGYEDACLAWHISEVFNVSQASAQIRIKQLKLGFQPVKNTNPSLF